MAAIPDSDALDAADPAAWRAWLEEHHATRSEVWLLIAKKGSPVPGVTLAQAVEEALCWGWIDGKARRRDEHRFALRFTPRKPGSVWSEGNVARVERLVAEGRMRPAGMALVEEAKRRGTWHAATAVALDATPPDLAAALAAEPAAGMSWSAWPPSLRRRYVHWVLGAKRPETRARRIAETVRRAAAGPGPEEPG